MNMLLLILRKNNPFFGNVIFEPPLYISRSLSITLGLSESFVPYDHFIETVSYASH